MMLGQESKLLRMEASPGLVLLQAVCEVEFRRQKAVSFNRSGSQTKVKHACRSKAHICSAP